MQQQWLRGAHLAVQLRGFWRPNWTAQRDTNLGCLFGGIWLLVDVNNGCDNFQITAQAMTMLGRHQHLKYQVLCMWHHGLYDHPICGSCLFAC